MLTSELINQSIPQLKLQDTVARAKQLINDFKLTHLPVVSGKKYLGMISEEDLLDTEDDKTTIENIQESFMLIYIQDDVHFLNAISYCNQYETNVVPVIDKSAEFIGVITSSYLLRTIGDFSGANEIGGLIILEMERTQFSISEISRIVETNDCTILHLNTTTNPLSGILTVTLHINKKEISAVLATFERFEYKVLHQFGTKIYEDKSDVNYKNLMNYLDM
ncbi:MAG: CBS domain-containing protein [Bacteroidota bacterium]